MKKTLLFTLLLIFTVGLNAANEARIGSTTYATLANAFSAVQDGDTIHLLSDVTQTSSIKIIQPVSFVFDGNGKTITRNKNIDLFVFSSAVSATFQNTTFEKGSSAYTYANYCTFSLKENAQARLTLKNCKISDYSGLYVGKADTVNIESGIYSGNYFVYYNYGSINVSEGSFSGTYFVYNNYGNININGGSISNTHLTNTNQSTGIVNIAAGTCSGTYLAYYNYGNYNISNGTFTGYYLAYYNYDNGKINIDNGTFRLTQCLVYSNGTSSAHNASLTVNDGVFTQSQYIVTQQYGILNLLGGQFTTATGIGGRSGSNTTIKGGIYNTINWFDNSAYPILIDGAASFTTDADHKPFPNSSNVNTTSGYYFYPSKDALQHVETKEIKPVTVTYYVGDELYHTDSIMSGRCSALYDLPVDPSNRHFYSRWVDSIGEPIRLNVTFIMGDTRLYAEEVEPVARIGETLYGSLSSAFSHVGDLDTIVLLKDVRVENPIFVSNDITFIFDGNGHTIENLCSENSLSLFNFIVGASATFQNVVVETNESLAESSYSTLINMPDGIGANLTLKNCQLQDYNILRAGTTNKVTVEGGFLQAYNCLADTLSGDLHVSDGSFSISHDFVNYNFGLVQVDNGSFELGYDVVGYNYDTLIVKNGSFDLYYVVYENIGGYVNLQDGDFDSEGYIVEYNENRDSNGEVDYDDVVNPTSVRGKVLVNSGSYRTLDEWIYENYGDVEIDDMDATVTDDYFVSYNYAAGTLVIHNGTVRSAYDSYGSPAYNYGLIRIENGNYEFTADFITENHGTIQIDNGTFIGDAENDSDFIQENYGIVDVNCEKLVSGGDFIGINDVGGQVTLNCSKMVCEGDIVETNSGEIHLVDGDYESFCFVSNNRPGRPPRPGSVYVAPKCIVENGTFVCRGCGFVVNNGTVDIHCDTFECGRDFLVENYDDGQVTLNCSIMVCVGDVVSNNAGTLVFANGYYYSDDDLVENNYGSVKIYDGNYETEDDIISYNEENATLKVLGGTFKSYHSLLYSNYGYARFDNVNYTSTDYYVVGNNYENGVLQINSGEYVSDSSFCICGDYSNEGFILLRGGSFRGKDDGIRNGRGTVLFDGFVVIDVADDTDGVLNSRNMSDMEINDVYLFYPDKTSAGHLETILNPAAPDVAQIDTVKFKTLEMAFDAAVSGDTILLLEDITITAPLQLNEAKEIVLDGDGHTLTADISSSFDISGFDGYTMIEIFDALHLTVKNLTTDVADSLQYGVLFYLDDNARANLHFENTTFHGYDIFWNGARDTLTLENCISSGIEGDIVNYNYGFVSFQSGEYAANDDIIGDNYGILEIYDGNYETDYDIIGYNEENATLEVLGGTFKSYNSLLNSNYGSALFENMNYTSTDHYVIGGNYSTGVLRINSGEYVSENDYCICGDNNNEGFILLRGGSFRGRDDGIQNNTGEVLFDGEVTFETSYDSDGVFYGETSGITVSPEYVFYPSKDAQGFLKTVPKIPVPVQFFVEDTLWHTEMHIPGEMDFDFPSFPTSGHPCPYDYWMDSVGQRVWNQYGIGLETRLYAHRPADSVNVTFLDGGSSTTCVVENGTPAANIPAFNAISNANFYGWHDENMLFYNDSTRVNRDVTLTAFYVVGDTVCNFNELKAAVNDKKTVIILCDMIPVLENLKITVSTTIVGMDSLCGLKRTRDYMNDPMVSIFDTLTVNFINLKLEGDSIRSYAAAIRVYARAGYPLNEHYYPIVPYDSASNRYVFANVNLINCWCQNFYRRDGYGGVIEASYTNLNLVSCDFEHNYAGNGGAVYWEPYSDYASANQNYKKGSLCTIRNCKFLYNECNSDGAAIVMGTGGSYLRDATSIDEMLDFCSMVIYDSQISYNTSAGSSGAIGTGWGVYALRGNTEVSYNYAERMGGVTGSYNNMLLILMDDVKVTHNQSYDGGAFGFSEGGMWMYGNSTLSFNEAEYGGAIYTGNMDDYHYIFAENATIYGNRASSEGGALYASDKFSFTSGHIYDNYAGGDGDDIDSYHTYVLDLIEEQPNRLYGSDTIGTRTIFVDEIPDRPTPAGISIPWKSWYKDGYSPRFHDPITSEVVDGFSLYNGDWYALKAIWYGLLLNYDANHGTDENVFADRAVKMYGIKTVENNMFEYPMHEFLGWNTEADGTGTHYDPEDIIIFDDHSQILYAEWCDMSTDTTFATSCTNYVWNGETYTESGTYTKIIELENSCDSLDVLVLTLADEPLQVAITPDSHSACPGVEAVLRAEVTSASDVLAYAWSTSATNDTLIVAPSTTSSYSLTVTDGYGCVGADTVVITVNPSYAQSESLTICQNELPYEWRDTTFNAGTVTGDYVFSRQTVNGCDSTVTLTLTVNPSALDMEDLTDYIRCNGGAFSVTPTGSIPEGTLYTWTVADNANVTGQSAQTTPVAAPISQTLTNGSDSKQTVVYTVTPITGGCEGDVFTITVDVEPTPELTLTCPDDVYDTLEFGSCALLIAPEDLGTPTWAHSLGWVLIDITNDAPADNIYPEGDNVITWTLTDECGNEQTCTQHVFVIFPECPDAVDYEGNVYHGVRIDCDCWTQRNLESNKYSDGSDIPDVYNYESDMYPDTDENVDKFGRLYDWESAINDGADNGNGHVQGICPEGWYLPTAEQYETLNLHGAEALKAPNYWLDGGGNNSTGFTSLPAGYYDGSVARYVNLMGEAYYWSTSMVNGTLQPSASVIKHICDELTESQVRSGLGYSVRCIKEKE